MIATLLAEEEGAFVVRESTSFEGCLGVAVRVSRVPANAPFITSERRAHSVPVPVPPPPNCNYPSPALCLLTSGRRPHASNRAAPIKSSARAHS